MSEGGSDCDGDGNVDGNGGFIYRAYIVYTVKLILILRIR